MSFERSSKYNFFRSSVPKKKILVSDNSDDMWTIFDAGPKSVKYPLVFLPPCSGTADIFYKQILHFSQLGYRVISVNYPVVWTINDWSISFLKLLDKLNIYQVHIFGASLGGYLAQKFIEFSGLRSPRCISLILCNSFSETSIFKSSLKSKLYWMYPKPLLQSCLMAGLTIQSSDPSIKCVSNFIQSKMQDLDRTELASRLTLNCHEDYVDVNIMPDIPITIIDVFDKNALTSNVSINLQKCYPNAKRAHLKSGGNFPYLSRYNDVNIFIQIHLNQFLDTPYEAKTQDLMNSENFNEIELLQSSNNSSFPGVT